MILPASHPSCQTDGEGYRLADGVGAVAFDGFAIVLDVRNDRYRRLRAEAADMLFAISSGVPIEHDAGSITMLEADGLVTRMPRSATEHWIAPDQLPVPSQSALEQQANGRASALSTLSMVWACTSARLRLRTQSLHHILSGLPKMPVQPGTSSLARLAHALDRARRMAPFAPRCLPDAIAFVHRARRQGHAVHLVFGVKAHPFEAHCWAQAGACVLTDPVDRVRRFEPILAL